MTQNYLDKAAMVYELLYHAPQMWLKYASRGKENITKSARFGNFSLLFLIKQYYSTRIGWIRDDNRQLLLAIYHLESVICLIHLK